MQKRHTVLITGVCGMLGTDLCRELGGRYRVIGTDILSGGRPKPRVEAFYPADITDRRSIASVIERARPAVVIHAAAWTDVDGCEGNAKKAYRINALGAGNVAKACGRAGAALIYISTDFVFDGRKRGAYRETDRTAPLSVYGDSKLEGERAVLRGTEKHYIVRTSWLYGSHGKNFVDTIIAKARTEGALKVVDDQVGSPTCTKDLSSALNVLVDAVTAPPSGHEVPYGVYHVSNTGRVSWYLYAKTILKLAGLRTQVKPISSRELARPARRPKMSVLDNAKFVRYTGFKMRNWKAALKEYIENR